MDQTELKQIVELVTQQVLKVMNEASAGQTMERDNRPKVLVLGDSTAREEELCSGEAVILSLDDYERYQDILRYDRVVIAKLSLTQLVDISNGRVGDSVSCAVIHALLNGVDTVIREDAFPHRKFAGKGSTALYSLLEKCAQTLQTFGIKPVGGTSQLVMRCRKPTGISGLTAQTGRRLGGKRLITEADARTMIAQGDCAELPADVIITPSARDVLEQARKKWSKAPRRSSI